MPQPHPLDAMLQLQPQPDGSFIAHTHAGYANMVGPYGGATAALLLHSVLQHPDCLGQPLSLTVNFAGPVQDGAMHLVPRAVRTNRSTQHWVVELRQTNTTTGQKEITTTATVVTAVRRATFSADAVAAPTVPAAADCPSVDVRRAMTWLQRYDWRAISGNLPSVWDDSLHPTQSQLWVRDEPPRPLDFASLAALCDVFFPRVWLRRARIVPAGTVSFTVYFHADSASWPPRAVPMCWARPMRRRCATDFSTKRPKSGTPKASCWPPATKSFITRNKAPCTKTCSSTPKPVSPPSPSTASRRKTLSPRPCTPS